MRITEKQKELLQSFACQRLTADEQNKSKIRSFTSRKGISLVDYLQKWAWDEDTDGSTAYYIVKNPEGELLLFFSLKCGALFAMFDEEERQAETERKQALLEIMQIAEHGGDREGAAREFLERIRMNWGVTLEEFRAETVQRVLYNEKYPLKADEDRAREKNRKIVRVEETYPAVELVHFCVNENARDYWRRCGIDHPMGEVLFWQFIAPKVFEVQEIVGCRYFYLFAADASSDGVLVNYYEEALHFMLPENVGTNKPYYDFFCQFMCQETNALRQNRKEYFENFNMDEDEDVV